MILISRPIGSQKNCYFKLVVIWTIWSIAKCVYYILFEKRPRIYKYHKVYSSGVIMGRQEGRFTRDFFFFWSSKDVILSSPLLFTDMPTIEIFKYFKMKKNNDDRVITITPVTPFFLTKSYIMYLLIIMGGRGTYDLP
jgi:hypothetical protein